MLDHKRAAAVRGLLALTFLLLAAGPALAYGVPGGSVEFVGYFVSLLTWLGLAFSAVFLWPLYALLRKIRGRNNKTTHELAQPEDAAQPAETAHIEQ
jgi:membrane protein implicated in regulation of membrane protease activity